MTFSYEYEKKDTDKYSIRFIYQFNSKCFMFLIIIENKYAKSEHKDN